MTVTNRFPLGLILATPGVLEQLSAVDFQTAIERHVRGDWGECCPEDREANDQALYESARLFSVYVSETGVRFWVITEADRSVTTVLLPDEY